MDQWMVVDDGLSVRTRFVVVVVTEREWATGANDMDCIWQELVFRDI